MVVLTGRARRIDGPQHRAVRAAPRRAARPLRGGWRAAGAAQGVRRDRRRRDAAPPRAADAARGREPRATGSSRRARRGSGFRVLDPAAQPRAVRRLRLLHPRVRLQPEAPRRVRVPRGRRARGAEDRHARARRDAAPRGGPLVVRGPRVLRARAPRRARRGRAADPGAPAPQPGSGPRADRPLAPAPPVRARRGRLRRRRWTRTAAFPSPRSSSATARSSKDAAAGICSWRPRRVPRRRRRSSRAGRTRRGAAMRVYRHLAPAGVLLHDELPSRVTRDGAGRPRIRAWPRGEDADGLRRGIAQLAELWFAAGARAVISPYTRLPLLGSAGRPREARGRALPPVRRHADVGAPARVGPDGPRPRRTPSGRTARSAARRTSSSRTPR